MHAKPFPILPSTSHCPLLLHPLFRDHLLKRLVYDLGLTVNVLSSDSTRSCWNILWNCSVVCSSVYVTSMNINTFKVFYFFKQSNNSAPGIRWSKEQDHDRDCSWRSWDPRALGSWNPWGPGVPWAAGILWYRNSKVSNNFFPFLDFLHLSIWTISRSVNHVSVKCVSSLRRR